MNKSSVFKTKELVYMAMFAVLLAVCSWISIPASVPFTLQTFGIFLTLLLLDGKRGTITLTVWILLGAIGVPVFAGFSGGLGILLGTTGGYILGFIFMGGIYWLMTSLLGKKLYIRIIAMVLGLAVCYAFGTIWFITVFSRANGPVGVMTALGWCVFPFIIPDLIKLVLAVLLASRLEAHVEL